jgi:hypothetical protein
MKDEGGLPKGRSRRTAEGQVEADYRREAEAETRQHNTATTMSYGAASQPSGSRRITGRGAAEVANNAEG